MVSPERVSIKQERATTLLATKLYIPQPRPNSVARPRLLARLTASLGSRLALVSAPAGFGKTTLLTEWARQRSDRVAWLSLDPSDKDPVRFWSYVIAALQRVDPQIGRVAESHLRVPPSGQTPFHEILTCLVNEIDSSLQIRDSVALILDDYHLVKSAVVDETLTFLLDQLPPPLHLIISSRVDPQLPLARLRARNQLVELRAADLRFTPDEITEFLNRAVGLDLPAEQITALDARTEGWIAGLQLAALSMRQREDRSGFIGAFAGSNRFILDYLVEEVLQQQPAEIQSFLLQTSILERMCAPLCDALMEERAGDAPVVSGGSPRSSQQLLEHLERENLFVIPLDDERRWYRYHPLFAEFLRHRLQKLDRVDRPSLYRRAAQWCEENALAGEAITFALASQDYKLAAHLIERHSASMLWRGEFITAHHWLSALPDDIVRSRAPLALCFAWTLLLTGRPDAVESYLQNVDRAVQAASEEEGRLISGEATAIRAFVMTLSGDAARTIDLCRRALRELPLEARLLRSMLALSLGNASVYAGDLAGADESLQLALTLGQSRGSEERDISHYAIACLAGIESIRGRLRHALELYVRALAREPADSLDLSRAQTLVGYGDLLREWNDLASARTNIDAGLALARRSGNAAVLINGHFSLARLLLAQGDIEGAMEMVSEAETIASQDKAIPIVVLLPADRTRMCLAAGRLDVAVEWLGTRGNELRAEWKKRAVERSALTPALEFEFITFARVLVGLGRQQARPPLLQEATTFLDEFLTRTEAEGRYGRAIELRILQAMAHAAQDHYPQAIHTLRRALEMAAPEGYVRLFVDEGEPLRDLIAACRSELAKRSDENNADQHQELLAYADKLLAAFASPHAEGPAAAAQSQGAVLMEPLSERETEILKLIIEGDSNQEIAHKLYLTVGTVKWHVNHILSKLNARNRHHAAIRARELNLLN